MRKKLIKKGLAEMRQSIKNAAPFHLTFRPCGSMTREERDRLEKELHYHFHLWAGTRIVPVITAIEQELDRK